MQAAREQFLEKEFKAVSIRQIATAAGVNGAMVNYYFGSKQGLYLAMVDELISELETRLRSLHADGEHSVEEFCASYSQLLLENPWWPNFIVREVLFGQQETRDIILSKFAGQLAQRLRSSLASAIARGHYRQDLQPQLTALSLMSMTIFPFLAKPVIEGVLGIPVNKDSVDQLVDHTLKLFHHGVLNTAKE